MTQEALERLGGIAALAEALHDEFWDETLEHGPDGCVDEEEAVAQRINRHLLDVGYRIARIDDGLDAEELHPAAPWNDTSDS